MTTPKVSVAYDLQRKHRLKRRLLRTLATSRKQQKEHEDAATDSDDSEVEVRLADQKKNFFQNKRLMDQSLEGKLLKQSLGCPISRLLPLAEAEIEPDDISDFGRFLKRQDSNSTIQTLDSMTARLAETNESPERPQKTVLIEKLSRIGARDEFSEIFTDDIEGESASGRKRSKNLFVRFADEHGEQLENVHWTLTMYSQEENDWVRVIILLLSPLKKKFEFLHVCFNIYDKTSVGDVLNQLPEIATDEALKEQNYVGLVRKDGERELINTVSLQSYCMTKNELLLAVVDGHYGKAMLRMAKPLFSDKKMMKAVTRSKSKKIHVTELNPVQSTSVKSTRKGERVSDSYDEEMCDIHKHEMTTRPELDVCAKRARHVLRHFDDNDHDMPDMSASFQHHAYDEDSHRNYLADDGNKDKVTLTRFLNAGIITAVVFGLQKRFHRGGKR